MNKIIKFHLAERTINNRKETKLITQIELKAL